MTDVKKKKRRIQILETDEELSDDEEEDEEQKKDKDKKKSKKGKLSKVSKDAEKEERERGKRLAEKQNDFNGIVLNVNGVDGLELERGAVLQCVLDENKEATPSTPVKVCPELCQVLKPHQAHGIKFLYDSTIEDLSRLESPGGGCILAHCMGLGKTLQVVCFLHTILTHKKINQHIKKALVVVPKNVCLNWENEFNKWVYDSGLEDIDVRK